MASYPTSIYTAAAKAAGNTIQAAHVNQLDDEVTAVETALITGPITLGTSTIANLSVTGASTFAGAVTFNGAVTFTTSVTGVTASSAHSMDVSSNASIGGTLTLTGQPRCLVTQASSQTISSGVETAVTFNTNNVDIGGFHSTASNPTQFRFPSTGFFYGLGSVVFDASGTERRYAFWRLNGAAAVGGLDDGVAHGSAAYPTRSPWFGYQCASTTDYVELLVLSKEATVLNNGGSTGNQMSRVFIHRVG